jgi:ATP-dependent Clp protease protease subunit
MKSIYQFLRKAPQASAMPAVKAAANEFFINDVIDQYWGANAKDLKEFLDQNSESSEIHIHINSPGGDAFEGRAMASLIRSFKGKTVCHVDGIAASAASIVAVSCDEVVMGIGTMLMIHNAWTITAGNKTDLIAQAELLDKCDQAMATDYELKSSLPREEIIAMMDAETWLTAEDAVEKKLADRIDNEKQKQDTSAFNLDAYDNTPESLLKKEEPNKEEPDFKAVKEANERRLQLFKFV